MYNVQGHSHAIILNKKSAETLTINFVHKDGFILGDGTELIGSTIIFPHTLFSWHVNSAKDVTEESLTLFKILDPKLDMLIFGFGNDEDFPIETRRKFAEICKKLEIKYEALPTEKAVGLFNFMSNELRFVAAALIPCTSLKSLKLYSKPKVRWEDLMKEEDEDEDENPPLIKSENSKKLLK